MKYAFMQVHRAEFSVRAMCRVLRIHVSGVYAWLKEPIRLPFPQKYDGGDCQLGQPRAWRICSVCIAKDLHS